MKYLIFIISFYAYSETCPANIGDKIIDCENYTCVKDESEKVKKILSSEEKLITEIELKKTKKACYLKFKSPYTGIRVCKFPKKFLKEMSEIYGEIEEIEGLKMFDALERLSESKNKTEFEKHSKSISIVENEMMQKQVKLQKIFSKNPKIKKYWFKFCRTNMKKVSKTNLEKYKKISNQINSKIEGLQSKIYKKAKSFKKL